MVLFGMREREREAGYMLGWLVSNNPKQNISYSYLLCLVKIPCLEPPNLALVSTILFLIIILKYKYLRFLPKNKKIIISMIKVVTSHVIDARLSLKYSRFILKIIYATTDPCST